MTRRWVERDHPRWPRGSGDQSGEFRDKAPDVGAWAHRLADSLDGPDAAGRHGSVATGLTQPCPVCGKTVKVVGAGKLSTHNYPGTSRRCTGSGQPATVKPPKDIQRAPTSRVPSARIPAKKTPKNLPGRPPPPPQVAYGPPLQPVDPGRPRDRMAEWQQIRFAASDADRQAKIHAARKDIRDWERRYETSRMQVARQLAQEARGVPTWQHVYIPADEAEQFLMDAESHQDVALNRRRLAARELDLERLLGNTPLAGEEFNPQKPLHYYGDLLHIEDDSWHVYEALDELEQQVPPIFHKVVAEFMRDQQRSVPSSGLYIGSTQSVRDLDDLRRKITHPPKGDWAKGATMATWDEVDGVVSHDSILAVVHTPNAESHRRSRRTALDRAQLGGTRSTGSAMLHEFGHVLDHALGFYENRYRTTTSDASEQRRFRLLYAEAKRRAWLSPHFTQKGDAGAREFWADTFYTWAAVPDPVSASAHGAGRPTTRDLYMAEHYRMPVPLAMKIVDYFDRLEKEVTTGKRLPAIELNPTDL